MIMRTIKLNVIKDAVRDLLVDSAQNINEDLLDALKTAQLREESPIGKNVLSQIIENNLIARKKNVPICQDTEMQLF